MVGPGCFLTLSSRVRVVPSGWAWLSGPGGRSAIKAAASSLLFSFILFPVAIKNILFLKLKLLVCLCCTAFAN